MIERKYDQWQRLFQPDPTHAALLVIDMQNGFVEKGGIWEVPMARRQIPKIKSLISACRRMSVPVIFTVFCVSKDFHYPFYWARAKERGLNLDPPDCHFHEGKHEIEVIKELAPLPGERVIKKCGFDAFAGTELNQILRSRAVNDLIIAGCSTNSCIDSTVRSAYHAFYNVFIGADCVAAAARGGGSAALWQELELNYFAEAFGTVMMCSDIVREMSNFKNKK